MLRLADTSIRMYRKKNGNVSYRLKSYLLVNSNAGFSLHAYLKSISAKLTLHCGTVIPMEVSYTIDTMAEHKLDTMTHWFWARGESVQETLRNSVGTFRLDYHISFTGHPTERLNFIEMVVPLVAKSRYYKGQ